MYEVETNVKGIAHQFWKYAHLSSISELDEKIDPILFV